MFPPSPPPTRVPHTKPRIHLLGAAVLQLGQNGDIDVFLWFLLGKSLREKKEQDDDRILTQLLGLPSETQYCARSYSRPGDILLNTLEGLAPHFPQGSETLRTLPDPRLPFFR